MISDLAHVMKFLALNQVQPENNLKLDHVKSLSISTVLAWTKGISGSSVSTGAGNSISYAVELFIRYVSIVATSCDVHGIAHGLEFEKQQDRSLRTGPALSLVAGTGFEPATFGL
ncbi:hypothetical protein [Acidithrix ferrooxidans]|uniref:Uncharacterized protein n=1 Tax=Acidithrix ferrooxidans TaxID=1280514 RepID=A0A0D8HG88_9ACTN|nr:hypothetical protein [Acidithrix ferrooxidans]KJF16844.1 hypothetical protein AXFE_22650 [Acidithrix ferrooxidans]